MGKKENYRLNLINFFDNLLQTNDESKIIAYLISNSNLPGPRGNLELADAFAEVVENRFTNDPERIWSFCLKLTAISADEAPVNDPLEFLPFCGIVAIGAIGSVASMFFQEALSRLRETANDPRWRTREAVAMGIQRLVKRQGTKTLKELEAWVVKGEWLAMRAVAAGVAEPALLKDARIAEHALRLHEKIFAQILTNGERKSEDFKTLKKGLGYSLSVVICAVPKEGFEYLLRLIDSQDGDILWIIRENLKKNRLIRNFPRKVASIKKLLN